MNSEKIDFFEILSFKGTFDIKPLREREREREIKHKIKIFQNSKIHLFYFINVDHRWSTLDVDGRRPFFLIFSSRPIVRLHNFDILEK